ncbi:hypothetical protein ACIBKX_37155 [Streptomyces sp. NPDC050658]|uniref:hypothetical protein n=1 Tax=unclassified Streptomyces TaxID=2593676 RepID=UPI00341FAD3A
MAAPNTAAEVDQITCAAETTTTYDPGLKLTSQPTTVSVVSSDLTDCVSATKPQIVSGGSPSGSGTFNVSCASLNGTQTGTRVINWSDGSSSTVSFTRLSEVVAGVLTVTVTGTVTSGAFEGGSLVQQMAGLVNPLDCLTQGIDEITANGTLTIVGV